MHILRVLYALAFQAVLVHICCAYTCALVTLRKSYYSQAHTCIVIRCPVWIVTSNEVEVEVVISVYYS